MLESTFLHLPSVGRGLERRLWDAGFSYWDHLWQSLRRGVSVRSLLRRARQRLLFAPEESSAADARSNTWLRCLDDSRTAAEGRNYSFFTSLLKPADHWRLLPTIWDDAVFLDIETTGLSRDLHYVTVIGTLHRGSFRQWTWPEHVDDLGDLLRSAPAVITFNGRRFDVPFLQRQMPSIPIPEAHVDLLSVARAAGLKGGQKVVESELGLGRSADLDGYDGSQAVVEWCAALYGDEKAYDRLLRYNRTDVTMMPRIASALYQRLVDSTEPPEAAQLRERGRARSIRRPLSHTDLRSCWERRRPELAQLTPRLEGRFGRQPIVVGIDLRANRARPTGWARCVGSTTETRILYGDDEILSATLAASPDLVSIDAPLSLPRGRACVSDDSPCRKTGGIVRDAERQLWARGIRVYPALIRQMQGLTKRGIELTKVFESHGIRVIESYPGAAQDVLNIPRKKLDESLLFRGLREFGYAIEGQLTHDELDAITSALAGQFFLADMYEAIGAADEGFMILPRWAPARWDGQCEAESFQSSGCLGPASRPLQPD